MKFLFNSLLLVTWLTFQMCQDTEDEYDSNYGFNIFMDFADDSDYPNDPVEEVLVSPNITMYQQVEDRGHFIVMCTNKLWSHSGWSSSKLSIESDNNYTLERVIHFQHDVNYYKITVSPPVSFTCVQKARFRGNITKLHSETYIFNQSGYPTIRVNKISVSDHREEGVSSSYVGFVSFIAVGLIIMTVVVIVTTFKSNSKEPTTGATSNDYEDA
ncbi:uncharacterized protein LOC130568288 isoform X2 [Triplophysa rosa]|uniref:Uncharacterized protein n=1 Tax=Triplophysa rosa TaxID=992332 RepID=A0A9W7TL36_TRIRA|nr:uncharacterized protein LOC130568288 isoform X2 [Triplophysa rosa]KAI7797934.1 hypothetical protein IRJ41_021192 [Triplophysa rosa]